MSQPLEKMYWFWLDWIVLVFSFWCLVSSECVKWQQTTETWISSYSGLCCILRICVINADCDVLNYEHQRLFSDRFMMLYASITVYYYTITNFIWLYFIIYYQIYYGNNSIECSLQTQGWWFDSQFNQIPGNMSKWPRTRHLIPNIWHLYTRISPGRWSIFYC